MKELRSRQGFALPAAVFALVVVGVLVTGGFYLARQETRMGVASERGTAAFYMAERGANEVMSQWDAATFGSLPAWSSATVADTTDDGIWSVNVTRMSSRLFFLLSTGTLDQGSALYGNASRILGVVARLATADVMPDAALTTVNSLKIGGSIWIIGHDSVPQGWSGYCDPPGASGPGILIDDVNNISDAGKKYEVVGVPPIEQDPDMTSENLMEFGDLLWDELKTMANKIYPSYQVVTQLAPDSVALGGGYVCQESTQNNWGDPHHPTSACGGYFPIIYAAGGLKISASDAGQGILLVDGDLEVTGGHEFYGPVIIRGTLTTTGTGGHFVGGVIAANVELDTSTVLGNAVVQFSSCAVTRAILNNPSLTQVRPLARRSWVDLSSVISGYGGQKKIEVA